jgi:hypothetical protein
MAMATTLSQAAGQSFDNLAVFFDTNQLKSRVTTFCAQTIGIFPQQESGSHPVSNWIAVFAALSARMPTSAVPIDQLTAAAEILYRLCWMAFSIIGNGITTAQASALLNSFNLILGF